MLWGIVLLISHSLSVSFSADSFSSDVSVDIHGHRGARAIYPENTLSGFLYALEVGVEYLEVDTQMTADGVVVVHHDPIVNRELCLDANGEPIYQDHLIKSISLHTIKSFDCGSVSNPKFPRQILSPGERIPTLQEVLTLAKLKPEVKVNVEIKYESGNGKYHALKPYVRAVVDTVEANQMQDRVIYQSFSEEVVKELKSISQNEVYFLFQSPLSNYQMVLARTKADGISVHYKLINKWLVFITRLQGKKILSWTANAERDWSRLMGYGIDGIITDDPEGLKDYIKRSEKAPASFRKLTTL